MIRRSLRSVRAICAGVLCACGTSSNTTSVPPTQTQVVGFDVTRVSPNRGPLVGGSRIVIEGDGFDSGVQVLIGSHPASEVTVIDTHTITAVVPPVAASATARRGATAATLSASDVVVQSSTGLSAVLRGGFTYAPPSGPAPTLASVSPGTGPSSGGTILTLTGTNFTDGTMVFTGAYAADLVTLVSPTTITARVVQAQPEGIVDVSITDAQGQSAKLARAFTFVKTSAPPPRLTGVVPQAGPVEGNSAVLVTGSGFQPGATVFVGGRPATTSSSGTNALAVIVPPTDRAGSVDVSVTNPDGQGDVLSSGYLYFNAPPVVTAVSPSCGSTAGGTAVSIFGRSFRPGASASIGGIPLAGLQLSNGALTGTTGPHGAGATTVSVTNPDAQTDTVASGFFFSDTAHPCGAVTTIPVGLRAVIPDTAPASVGGVVTLLGDGFVPGSVARVTFGKPGQTHDANYIVVLDQGQIQMRAPQAPIGYPFGVPADVVVAFSNGRTVTLPDSFTWFDDRSSAAAPTLSQVTPTAGPSTGGTHIVLTGANFGSSVRVVIGGIGATVEAVLDSSRLVAIAPALPPGAADVQVFNPDGKSALMRQAFVSYQAGAAGPAPLAQRLNPSLGSTQDPVAVSISGLAFQDGAAVLFGSVPATGVSLQPDGSLAALVAPQPAGSVDVVVSNPDGQFSVLPRGFTFVNPPPRIASIQPAFAPTAGGTSAVVSGSGFLPGDVVLFGGASGTSNVVDSTAIFAVVPPHAAGFVDVLLLRQGSVLLTLPAAFEFRASATPGAAPAVAAVEPNTGPASGGTVLWMTGTNFASGMQVFFGANAATRVTLADATHAIVTAPAGNAGTVDVNVINPDGQAGALLRGFSYVADAALVGFAPVLTAVTPDHGPESTDTVDLLSGRNFVANGIVIVGAARGAGVRLLSSSIISATFPHQPAGTVDVTVTSPDGRSTTLPHSFTFGARPTVVSVVDANGKSAGPTAGGTPVTIAGSGFLAGASVTFAGVAATSVTVASASIITAVTPAGVAGPAAVTVANPDGQAASLAGAWLYLAPPLVTSIFPTQGPPSGGTIVLVTGDQFSNAIGFVGGAALETVAGTTPTHLAITMPAGTGTVDVVVKNADGQAFTLPAAFTYTPTTSVPPTLSSIAPATGSANGWFAAIAGTGFAPGSHAIVGGDPLGDETLASAAIFTGIVKGSPGRSLRVAVTTPDGLSARLDGAFTTVDDSTLGPPPTISNTVPSSLPAAPGGSSLVIAGANFQAGALAFVQGLPAPVLQTTATAITVTAPVGHPGDAEIVVTNPAGQSAIASGIFHFTVPPPQLDPVQPLNPVRGPTAGGTPVVIRGSFFKPPVQVLFGSSAATIVSASDHEIDVKTPAGVNGPAAVVVVNSDGQQSSPPASFLYNAPPAITQLSPTSGSPAGGFPVTIQGQFFSGTSATISVKFGANTAAIIGTPTSTVVTVTAPAASGTGTQAVAVTLTNDDGQSTTLPGGFVYLAPGQPPLVSGVTPNAGGLQGGDVVTVLGSNFQFGATVSFGGVQAQGAQVTSPGALNATVPAAAAAGAVDVTVRNPDGQQSTLAGGYTYVSGPPPAALTITFVEPAQGDAQGGTRVLIGGTGFAPGATVAFVPHDGSACAPSSCALTAVEVLGPTAIAATVPPQPLPAVANYDVSVAQSGATLLLPNAWTYGNGRRRWVPTGLRMPMESHNGKGQRSVSGAFTPAWSGVIAGFTQRTPGVADVWMGGNNGRAPRLYQGNVEIPGARQRVFTDLSRNQRNSDGSVMSDNCCGSSSPYNYRPFKPQAFDLDGDGWPEVAFWNDDRHVFTIEWNGSGVLQATEYGGPFFSVDPSDWAGGFDANGRMIDLNLDGAPDFVFTDGGGRTPWVMLSCATGLAGPGCSSTSPARVSVAIAPGPQTITTAQLGNLGASDLTKFLFVGTRIAVRSASAYEALTVSAVTTSSFTATFTKTHAAGASIWTVFDVTSSTNVSANTDASVSVSSMAGFGLSSSVTLVADPGTPAEEHVTSSGVPDFVNSAVRFHFTKAHTAPFRITSKHLRSFVTDAARFPANATDVAYSLVVGDVDGNGSSDVITGNSQQGIKVWLNDAATLKASGGDPNAFSFTLATSTTIPSGVTSGNVRALSLFDANGDGLPDLLVGYDGNTQERIFINQGSGIFADETTAARGAGCKAGTNLPRLPLPVNDSIVRYDIRDFNGDGAADVLAWVAVNSTPGSVQKPLRLWLNDGNGCFVANQNVAGTAPLTDLLFPPALGIAPTWAYALGDFNGDGFPDMIAAFDGIQTREYVNTGTPQFLDKTLSNFPAASAAGDSLRWWRWTRGSLFVDVNGDGYPDLITTQVNADPNAGQGGSFCGGPQRQCYLPPDGSGIHVYLNDQNGRFPHDDTLAVFPTATDPVTKQVVSALPIASWSMDAVPHLSSAPGAPQAIVIASATDYSAGVPAILKGTAFDLPTGTTRLLLANGDGTFSDGTYPRLPTGKTAGYTSAIRFVDLDGDGNADLVLGDAGTGAIQIWQNEGNGFFADVTSTAVQPAQLPQICGNNRVNQIAVANFDGDDLNRPDLLVVRDCQSRLLVNRSNATDGIRLVDESTCDGSTCATPRLPTPPPGAVSAVVADLDCIGGPDLFLLQSDGNGSPKVLLNSVNCGPGSPCGFFTDASNTYLPDVSACVGTDCGGNMKAVPLRYDSSNTDIFIARYSADGSVRQHRLLKNRCGSLAEYTRAAWLPVPVDDDKIVDVAVGSLFQDNRDPTATLYPDLLLTGYFATRVYQNTP